MNEQKPTEGEGSAVAQSELNVELGNNFARMRDASYLLPPPGGEVVRELISLNLLSLREIGRMRKLLIEAADDIEHWGAYADPYFQEKWNLADDIEKYRDAAMPNVK